MPEPSVPVIIRNYHSSKYTRTDFAGVLNGGSFDTTNNLGVYNTKIGAPVPGWRQLMARHADASSAYDRKVYGILGYPSCRATSKGYVSWPPTPPYHKYEGSSLYMSWHANPFLWVADVDDFVVRDIALAKLKSKINRASTRTNVLIPLGELHKLRGLVRGMADHSIFMVKRLLDIKRGAVLRGPKWGAKKRAGDAWLTWAFGMKPMMSDAERLATAIAGYLSREPDNIQVHGSHSKVWYGGTNSAGTTAGVFNGVTRYWHDIEHELRYTYSAGLFPDVKSGNDYAALKHFGISIPELVPAMWELTAFSWLFDYFTTTGAVLEDVFSASNSQTIYCTLSRVYKYKVIGHAVPESRQTPGSGTFAGSKISVGQAKHTHFTRTKLSQIPTRAWRFKTRDEIAVNSVNKLLNLAALLLK